MCKVANKCLNVRERVEVVEWNKMVPSLPLLSCELSVSVKENPDRKKNIQATIECGFSLKRVRDVTRTYSQIHRTDKYSERSSIIWPVWING